MTASVADLTLTAGTTVLPDVPGLVVTYGFGDASATEDHPVADQVTHTYAAGGDYTVTADAVPVDGYEVSGATETVTATAPTGATGATSGGLAVVIPIGPSGPAGPVVIGERQHRRRVRTSQRPAPPTA